MQGSAAPDADHESTLLCREISFIATVLSH